MAPLNQATRRVRGALATGVAVLLLSACSAQNPLGTSSLGPSLPVIAHDAVVAYRTARSVELQGSYVSGSVPVTVRLSLQPSAGGGIRGRATYNHAALAVVGDRGRVFTKGLAYWQAQGAGGLRIWPQYGAGWVLTPSGDPGATSVSAAGDLGGLLQQLERQSGALVSRGVSRFKGRRIAVLRDGRTTYDVTASAPYRLLAVRRTGTTPGPQGLRSVDLRISYGGRLRVTLPASGHYVNPLDASTFPALFEVQSTSGLQSCNESSCGFSATLLNTGGTEQGKVTASLTLYQNPNLTGPLGSCTVPVPQVASGQTTTVSCRITDPAYQTFYLSLFGSATVYRHVTLQNPPYTT